MRVILIRYGEIFLKGNNRSFFIRSLKNNIVKALSSIKYEFVKSSGRLFIENYDVNNENLIINKLTKVFGIHSISPTIKIDTDIDNIINSAIDNAPRSGTFKVHVNRADKTLPLNSMQIASKIGAKILHAIPNLKVDLHNPQSIVNIDIRENHKTYIIINTIKGQGGMPVGTAGRGMLLLSGGIDSPVACYMMSKRGMTINAVHFHSFPYTSEKAKQKVLDLAKIISNYSHEINLNIVSLTEIQQEINMKCRSDYMITLVRRFMLKIASILANKQDCKVLLTGESLGQVASQTIESINTISESTNMQILRPLIAMDKSEIMDIAHRINTYDKSIEPYEDCCTVFLPKNPVIKPSLWIAKEQEALLDVDKLIERALQTLETIRIEP